MYMFFFLSLFVFFLLLSFIIDIINKRIFNTGDEQLLLLFYNSEILMILVTEEIKVAMELRETI